MWPVLKSESAVLSLTERKLGELKEPELCATFYYGRDGERERRMSCAGLITKMNQNDQNIFKYSKRTRERERK